LKSKDAVAAFAEKLGIHPAIVVGRLQHEGMIRNDWMNGFKESVDADALSSQTIPSDEFDHAGDYVLNKNRDLYERLSCFGSDLGGKP
jgi:hypothetical protein